MDALGQDVKTGDHPGASHETLRLHVLMCICLQRNPFQGLSMYSYIYIHYILKVHGALGEYSTTNLHMVAASRGLAKSRSLQCECPKPDLRGLRVQGLGFRGSEFRVQEPD